MTGQDVGMRLATGLVSGLGLFGLLALSGAPVRAEYYCSPGFEPISRGRCVAVAARDEIQLYLNDPELLAPERGVQRHHRRHGLRTRY